MSGTLLNGRPSTIGWLARTQAPVQAVLRPAMWLPAFITKQHSAAQQYAQTTQPAAYTSESRMKPHIACRWECAAQPATAFARFLEVVEASKTDFKLIVAEVHQTHWIGAMPASLHAHMHTQADKNRNFACIYTFTAAAEWLDLIEVSFVAGPEGTSIAKVGVRLCVACCLFKSHMQIKSFSTGVIPVSVPLAPLLNVVSFYQDFFVLAQTHSSYGHTYVGVLLGALPGSPRKHHPHQPSPHQAGPAL